MENSRTDRIARAYVKLALKLDLFDPGFVDAYFGPEHWRPPTEAAGRPAAEALAELSREAEGLAAELRSVPAEGLGELQSRRHRFLGSLLRSVRGRIEVKQGKPMSFDGESEAIYGIAAPRYEISDFEGKLAALEEVVPGKGPLAERCTAFRERFAVAPGALGPVFDAAIGEARKRTAGFIPLPAEERFTVEFVQTDAGWSAYNWYKGSARSVIQVNTKVPVYVDQIVHYAAHEGYPGHHLQGTLRDYRLYRGKGWVEHSVAPLFAPTAVLAEGAADYGVEVAFPGRERLEFERDALFPLAGLDAGEAEACGRVGELRKFLWGAVSVEAGRRYLDGELARDEAVRWLREYGLESLPRCENRIRFFENYRSYVINYSVGEDLVRKYAERRIGRGAPGAGHWALLEELFSVPFTPSMLA